MLCGSCFLPSLDFLQYARAAERVAGVSRLVLHAFIHFLRSENLLVVGKGDAHPLANPGLILALKRQNVSEEQFDTLVHRVHRLPSATDNSPSTTLQAICVGPALQASHETRHDDDG